MTARASKKTFEGELLIDALPISWIRNGPIRNRPVLLLAHGAGAPQTSSFMDMVTQGLVERDISVVRFNFPYMERAVREGKRRPPDVKRRLLASCAAMFSHVVEQMPKNKRHKPALVVGGKSMGGRMLSMLVAEGLEDGNAAAFQPAGLVYFGYPLHPPGKPESLRTAHLSAIRPPQLFVSGSRDSLARMDILEDALKTLPKQPKLHVVDGGDHSLTTSRKDPTQGADAWLDVTATFILRYTRTRLDAK